MGKGKQRKYPGKKQNNYPQICPRYETYSWTNKAYCEGGNVGDAEICKGNPHNCIKTKYHRIASTPQK